MATNDLLAKNEEQQNIVGQNISAQSAIIRNSASTPAQIEAATQERDRLRIAGRALTAEAAALTNQTPATSLYEGVDQNSGESRYYNPATGTSYIAATPPTPAQQANVKDPASGFINPTTEKIVSPPAVATAQVPVNVSPAPYDEFAGLDSAVAANAQAQLDISDEEALAQQQNGEAALDQLVIVEQQQASLEEYTNAAQAGYDTPEAQKQAEDQSVIAGIETEQTIAENTRETARFAARGLSSDKQSAQGKATQQDVANFKKKEDWRVRLSLAPNSNYLYNDPSQQVSDLLYPLKSTDGVIFPYTPAISVAYAAHYDSSTLTHSNYKIFQYGSSSVDTITITCDFTAQDTSEANYLLAVIHFFKSATKMFYGQDQNPKPGTPPPLCYLSGLGDFQFDAHPLAITGFNYTLPTDVDYIRAGRPSSGAGVNNSPTLTKDNGSLAATAIRLISSLLTSGAQAAPPKFGLTAAALQSTSDATYVPTKMSLSITAIPIVTRNDISKNFSLKDYATGKLLQGSKRQGGGIW